MSGRGNTPRKRALKNFFTLLFSGKLSKAENSLEGIRKRYKLGKDDPYYKALYGIYYTYTSDDRDSFIFKLWERYLNGEKKNALRRSFKEILEKSYDPPRRFIKAWLDLIDMLDILPRPHKIKKPS